eukprot:SAG22_NODE_27_length_29018_cov_465.809646_6_plen_138_part_00
MHQAASLSLRPLPGAVHFAALPFLTRSFARSLACRSPSPPCLPFARLPAVLSRPPACLSLSPLHLQGLWIAAKNSEELELELDQQPAAAELGSGLELNYWGYQTCTEFGFYQTCEVGSKCMFLQVRGYRGAAGGCRR